VSVFRTDDPRIYVCASDSDGVQERHTGLYWFRRSLRPVRAARILALVCSRGYKPAREGTGSQVSGGEVLCGCMSVVNSVPPTGVLPFPFICEWAGAGYTRERSRGSRFFSSLRVVPVGPIDDDGCPCTIP
jgi:hypothetical protein